MDKPKHVFWLTQYLPFLVFRYFLKCSGWNVYTHWVCVERETCWEFTYSAFVAFLCGSPSLAVPEASTPTSIIFLQPFSFLHLSGPWDFFIRQNFLLLGPEKRKWNPSSHFQPGPTLETSLQSDSEGWLRQSDRSKEAPSLPAGSGVLSSTVQSHCAAFFRIKELKVERIFLKKLSISLGILAFPLGDTPQGLGATG